jgi:hypothetical protein
MERFFCGDFKFKGHDGIVYAIDVCLPPVRCDAPCGIMVYAFGKDDQYLFDSENIPEIEIKGAVDPALVSVSFTKPELSLKSHSLLSAKLKMFSKYLFRIAKVILKEKP